MYHAAVPPLGAAAEGDPEVVVGVTSAVVAAAAGARVRRLVLQSHVGAVDDPERPRLQAKARAEAVVRASGVPWTILRPTLLFGEGDHVTALLVRLAREQPMVPVLGRGNALLQPLWVGDYGRVLLRCLEEPGFEGQVVDVGGPEHLTWDAFVDAVLRASGTSRPKLHIARGLANFLAQGMEWTMRAPPATRGELDLLFRGQDLTDPDALERRFGFKPRPFRDALGYLRAPGLPRSDTDLGPPPEAGAPPGTPHGREPGRPGMRGP